MKVLNYCGISKLVMTQNGGTVITEWHLKIHLRKIKIQEVQN